MSNLYGINRAYSHAARISSHADRAYSHADRAYSHAARIYTNAVRAYSHAARIYTNAATSLSHSESHNESLSESLNESHIVLNGEQQAILDIMKRGQNVYFTGKAGSGKTMVLRHFIHHLKTIDCFYAVTAPTGIAANLINGQTIHSLCLLNSDQSYTTNLRRIKNNDTVLHMYMHLSILIIDEISMLSPRYFDMLNRIFCELRSSTVPFGGVQMVLSGDFYQLAPVDNNLFVNPVMSSDSIMPSELLRLKNAPQVGLYYSKRDLKTNFLFSSAAWAGLLANGMQQRMLKSSIRQQNPLFVALLDDLRHGVCSPEMWRVLDGLRYQHNKWNLQAPILLSGYKNVAHSYNQTNFDLLPGTTKTYLAIDSVSTGIDPEIMQNTSISQFKPLFNQVDAMYDQFQPEMMLFLKINTKVMLLKNLSIDANLVNGSQGIVVGFVESYDTYLKRNVELPVVKFDNCNQEYVIGFCGFYSPVGGLNDENTLWIKRRQIPLKHGWALTIHKSQGLTLDNALIHLPRAISPGQAYVGLSRVRNLSGISLLDFGYDSLLVSDKVVDFYRKMQ
jgi:ATP-dependent DNA helicase PIF1